MKVFRIALIFASSVLIGGAAGQVITLKKVEDKTIGCMRSGLFSDLNDCGFKSEWYTYVFVGKISAVNAVEHDEQQVQIIPEEVFAGKPQNPMKVFTSQGPCLPKLVIGDQWLFYLRRVGSKPIVLDYYGNDSLPMSEANERVAILRRLKSIKNSGILRGKVSNDGKPIPNASVFARRLEGGQYTTKTTADGRYEFESLVPGEYKVSTKPNWAYQPSTGDLEIKPESCWDLTLRRAPGRVQ